MANYSDIGPPGGVDHHLPRDTLRSTSTLSTSIVSHQHSPASSLSHRCGEGVEASTDGSRRYLWQTDTLQHRLTAPVLERRGCVGQMLDTYTCTNTKLPQGRAAAGHCDFRNVLASCSSSPFSIGSSPPHLTCTLVLASRSSDLEKWINIQQWRCDRPQYSVHLHSNSANARYFVPTVASDFLLL